MGSTKGNLMFAGAGKSCQKNEEGATMTNAMDAVQVGDRVVGDLDGLPLDEGEIRKHFGGLIKPNDQVAVRVRNLVVIHGDGTVPSEPHVTGF